MKPINNLDEYVQAVSKLKYMNCYTIASAKFILAKKNIAQDYEKVSVDSTKGNLQRVEMFTQLNYVQNLRRD